MQEHIQERARVLFEQTHGQTRDPSVPLWVIDTNVILDFIHFHNELVQPILQAIDHGEIQVVAHPQAFVELYDVICRPMFKADPDSIEPMLSAWLQKCVISQEALQETLYCKDSDDDKFFEIARLNSASVLVSKDKLVFKARHRARRFGCEVLKPEQALKLLNKQ